jgi:hypothetical protein
MPFIPTICNDANCRAIYPSDFTINKVDETNAHSGKAIPCPNCGSTGTVSSSDYDTITHLLADKVSNAANIQLCKQIQKKIDKTLKKNKPHKTLKELEKLALTWQDIWKFTPNDKAEAYAFLRLVFSFVSTAISTYTASGKVADKAILINKSYNHFYQLVSPSLATNNKRPQIKTLTNAIRKTRK